MTQGNDYIKRRLYCFNGSQYNNSLFTGSCVEYNANNTWNFNGNNRCFNNNNRYNGNFRPRPVLDFKVIESQSTDSYFIPLETIIELEKESYNGKRFAVEFRTNYIENILDVWHRLNNFDVTIDHVYKFVINVPKVREIIFCDYKDKLIQSFFVKALSEKLEKEWFDEDSYSCRKGNGVICAVNMLRDYIRLASKNYTVKDIYIGKIDIKNFFMTIDTNLAVKLLIKFIDEKFEDGLYKDLLKYLTNVLYLTDYSNKIINYSNPILEMNLMKEKMLETNNPLRGVPIGNWPSQEIGNFLTTIILRKFRKLGYLFSHYTDDTAFVIKDKDKFLNDIRYFDLWYKVDLHLEMHKNKRYLQHYTKGVEFLGRKIKFDRLLPSNRTYNSVEKLLYYYLNLDKFNCKNMKKFMDSMNSYFGLLRSMNTFNYRKSICYRLHKSKFEK